MAYQPNSADQLFEDSTASLADGAELDSGWMDLERQTTYQVSVFAAAAGLDFVIDSSEEAGGGGVNDVQSTTALLASFFTTLPPRERYMRFRVQNNTGGAITNVKFDLKGSTTTGTGASVFPVYVSPADFSPAILTQSVSIAQQPDGDYVTSPSDGSALSTTSTLAAGATYTSAWIDSDGWNTIEIFVATDTVSASQGIVIEYTDDSQAGTPTVRASKTFHFSPVDVQRGFRDVRVPASLDGFRIKYINGVEAQNNFFLDATLRTTQEPNQYNDGNALVTSDFFTEVVLGNISNFTIDTKFGRNPEVDTNTDPEDVWAGGGNYTGFNAVANQNIAVVSTSTADAGTLVSSGTVTSASLTQIIDTSATFSSDGVAVGDVVLNDTQGIWGIVKTIDSETVVTVQRMQDGTVGAFSNFSGDSYRIVTPASTGAAVVQLKKILNIDCVDQGNKFVILNGTNTVTLTVDGARCSRAQVILAGTGGGNAGIITANQATTTANKFVVIPIGSNQSTVACDTVPSGKTLLIRSLEVAITRASGAAGSATISLRVRPQGSVFQAKRVYEVQTGGIVSKRIEGGLVIAACSDIKFRVDQVSDNDTIVQAEYEYITLDN